MTRFPAIRNAWVLAAALAAAAACEDRQLMAEATSPEGLPPAAVAPPSPGPLYNAEGTVVGIGPDSITIRHGPVEELGWSPGTRPFRPRTQEATSLLQVDQQVAFTFSSAGGAHQLTSILPLAPRR
jgi:Cu/Ag efflux protein CusF